ncbi:MAG: polyprenyl synthetase family protein [Spirochaetales bacterium]|nr:polyprenyl synthetase family protein [Spirochaetales bacterium]
MIEQARTNLRSRLERYFREEAAEILRLSPWGPDVRRRLADYTQGGKLIRGSLVHVGFSLFHPDRPSPAACVEAGVAMELIQSFLLVHDDIMDQDAIRRGSPAIHSQYESALAAGPSERAGQYGLSMGICAGDVAAFLAMERLAALDTDHGNRQAILSLVSREIAVVGLAQMQDVHHGYIEAVPRQAILDVYTYKTGRYTFSLPLMIGAILADASEERRRLLARFGEHVGRIFQIRDDYLGIFGASKDTGKPVGSDIREDKQTLFRSLLFERTKGSDPVRRHFGSSRIDGAAIEEVRRALADCGVLDEVKTIIGEDERAAAALIEELAVGEEGRAVLATFVDYNVERTV